MAIYDTDRLFSRLEEMGEETVRLKLAQGVFAPQRKIDLVMFWLSKKEKERQKNNKINFESKEILMKLGPQQVWDDIEKDYDITKRIFGKKINFIEDQFKKKIIFRDVEHAYVLANLGFLKPAVVLAGSVIEELLRIYLEHKKIAPKGKTFDSYIKACDENGLLKSAIHRLTDSVRHFRNIVHLSKENSKRETISKATAKGAVSSIFTVANDF